jgi:hypothetical protein
MATFQALLIMAAGVGLDVAWAIFRHLRPGG